MRCTLAVCCLLVLSSSCSKPQANPPQAAPTKPASEPLATETPAVEVQVDAQSVKTSPVETPLLETPLLETLPVERTGPLEVGEQAPDFRLQDQDGTERTLEGLLAEGKVALVFYRSADW